MYLIFDHLVSVVVGTVLLMLLATLYLRTQDENVDAIRSEANRARMLDVVHVLERDLRNAGSGSDDAGVLAWSGALPATEQPVVVLEFYTTVDTSAAADPSRLRYDLAVADSTRIDGEWVPLYQLRRLEFDGSDYMLIHASTPTLAEFELGMLDQTGAPTAQPDQARAFSVRVITVSPFGVDGITGDTRWETTLWPLNLRL